MIYWLYMDECIIEKFILLNKKNKLIYVCGDFEVKKGYWLFFLFDEVNFFVIYLFVYGYYKLDNLFFLFLILIIVLIFLVLFLFFDEFSIDIIIVCLVVVFL